MRMAQAHLGKGLPAVKMICNNYTEEEGHAIRGNYVKRKIICILQQTYCKNGKPTDSHCPGLSEGPPGTESLCLLAEGEILLSLGAYLLSAPILFAYWEN